ncbi:MAG TPA: RNA-binding protein [Blastocatellia bacterium]|jgi:RNA recognition motif-containing protein|nr:RNA-binding protein [Blastocatellia bacterium]
MSAKLFVGNLSHDTTGEDLRALFGESGQVESCSVITDRDTGRSKGFAFVEMGSNEEAKAAKEKLNGQDLHGRALKIDDAKPRTDKRDNRGGYGGSRRY